MKVLVYERDLWIIKMVGFEEKHMVSRDAWEW
jgi:hypothetical protein